MNAILLKVIDIIYRTLRIFHHYFFAIINGFRGEKVPPVKDPALLMSATQLAKHIRDGTLSSFSIVQAYVNRILEVEPYINATVDRRFEDALEEAKAVDFLVASKKMTREQMKNETPLLGVPFTVKILITVKGFSCTAGSLLFEDLKAQDDGVSVSLMKKAGAILLASTNSSECGMNLQSSNYIYGTTCNPYDTSRTSGGGTGGESALIAAAGSLIGLGSDLGGSLRIPGLFTGIFSHKTSPGLVSNKGCFPFPERSVRHMLSTGPMCRYAEDLVTTMRILSVPGEICNRFGYEQVNFKNLKVYYLYSFGESIPLTENVDPEIKEAVRRVVSHFHIKGSRTEETWIPLFKYSSIIFIYALLSLDPDLETMLTAGKVKLDRKQELINLLTFRSTFTLGYVMALNAKSIPFVYYPDKVDVYKQLEDKLRNQLTTLLNENSILVLPTMPFPAPYNHEITILAPSCGYTSIFNVLGLPSTQCPVGLNKQGLPLGVQIVGRRGNDPLTVSCAQEVERAFGGWKTP